MGKEPIIEKLKSIIFEIIKPIYLWSIGFKSLEEYITCIEEEYEINKKLNN